MTRKSLLQTQTLVTPATVNLKIMEHPRNYKRKRKHPETTLLKRIPLHKLMDLKIDYAFKRLFGEEKNKQITVVFLNAIFQKTGREPIKDISFDKIELHAEYVNDKSAKVDFLVTTESNEKVNVEIQLSNKYDMIKRSIYYWARIYQQQMEKGMEYEELKSVIAINIMDFNEFVETNRFHTMYHLQEDEQLSYVMRRK